MSSDNNSYGSIVKAIGLFGGVQIFQIIVGLVRNKFVAILLGPAGMGIVGLITSTTAMVEMLAGMGLSTSAVRDISQAYSSNSSGKIGLTYAVMKKMVVLSGLVGTIFVFLFASQLSRLTFGNTDYTFAFRLVSVTMILNQLCVGQRVLLQGTFHYKYMAEATLYGSLLGLFVSVPLYYLWGETAIVPVIIFTSVLNVLFMWIYARKLHVKKVEVSVRQSVILGKTMIVLGLTVAITAFVRLGGSYTARVFISNWGGLKDVGLFMAGLTISTQYVDVILTSMGSDYAPRLASMYNDRTKFIQTMNRQLLLLTPIMMPIIVFFLVFNKFFIVLLYSNRFLDIIGMLEWMMFGMYLRTVSWCFSYAQVARGDSNCFFWNETLATIYNLLLTLIGYKISGFTGVGVAFFVGNFFYTIQMYLMSCVRFGFKFVEGCLNQVFLLFVCLSSVFIVLKLLDYSWWRYLIGSFLLILTIYISYKRINEMIPIGIVVDRFMKKVKKI